MGSKVAVEKDNPLKRKRLFINNLVRIKNDKC